MIVNDAKMMGEAVLEDEEADYTFMPKVADLGECGWPCKDVSTMNVHARENRKCIEVGAGKTGQGFSHYLGYLRSHHAPMFGLGENVLALFQYRFCVTLSTAGVGVPSLL